MPTVIIPPTDVSPNTGSGSEVLATDPVFPNNITVNGTTDSSSKDTGAIVTEGGLGVEKSATIGGNLTVSGTGDRSATIQTTGTANAATLGLTSGNGTTSGRYAYSQFISSETSGQTWNVGMYGEKPFTIRDGSTPFLTITNGTGAATLADNLTVSGAGTSSVAGSFGIRTTALSNYGGVLQVKGRQAWLPSTWTNLSTDYLAWMNVDDSTNKFYIQTLQNNGTNSGLVCVQPNGGNLLIGTTTDTGEKLQVSGTAYVSGNATFAGTIALTGSSAGQIATWNSSNANGIYHTYLTNGTAIGDIGSAAQAVSGSASDFGITSRAGKLVLGTSSSARLTIDTTGNATFTGTVKIANTAEIKGVYTTTTTFDFGTIANNDASSVCTLTMTGVSSSDSIIVTPTDGDNFPQFCTVSAVPSGNSVSVRLYNGSGSSRTVGSRTIRVTAIKF